MRIRGAASLADVPYWRKPKNRLTALILPGAGHFLKAFFAHLNLLRFVFTVTYISLEDGQNGMSRRPVWFGFRGDFQSNIRARAAVKWPTI